MTNEIQQKVIQWLEASAQAIGDFTAKEVPPFIHEYLQWKMVEATVSGVGCFAIAIALAFAAYKMVRKIAQVEDLESWIVPLSVAAIVCTAASCGFLVTSIEGAKDALQIKIAPKVYLVEKAAELIKGNKQ
jgi:hypothetical protein